MTTPNLEIKDHISEIYKAYDTLETEKHSKRKKERAYIFLLEAVEGDLMVRQLAAQFIPRFFDKFPKLEQRAVDALLDLCEDDEKTIRIHAIHGLAELCTRCPMHVGHIADVLGQLLLADEGIELQTVKRAFHVLFNLDMEATFEALFQQIKDGDDDLRKVAVGYLNDQVLDLHDRITQNEESQKYIIQGIIGILENENGATGAEFKICLCLLLQFEVFQNSKPLLVEIGKIIIKQAQLEKLFDPKNEEHVSQFLTSFSTSNLLASRGIDGTPFMSFFIRKICPVFEEMSGKNRFSVLKAVAEYSKYVPISMVIDSIDPLYKLIKTYIPKEDDYRSKTAPKINFSVVECLLYIFHQLASKDENAVQHICSGLPPVLSDMFEDNKPDVREDFDDRLYFLRKKNKEYMSQLDMILQSINSIFDKMKNGDEKNKLEEKQHQIQVALITASNLQIFINNLLKGDSVFLGDDTITLSWMKKNQQMSEKKIARHSNKVKSIETKKSIESDVHKRKNDDTRSHKKEKKKKSKKHKESKRKTSKDFSTTHNKKKKKKIKGRGSKKYKSKR